MDRILTGVTDVALVLALVLAAPLAMLVLGMPVVLLVRLVIELAK